MDATMKEPGAHITEADSEVATKKIVLCFDGTSNQFKGTDSDTNVVKVYQMLDRSDKHQYHYYQPGIGTYRANSVLQNTPSTGFFAKTFSAMRAKADEALAGSFADHVMSGYKFLMRYYMEGDKIYIFGFSRGSYTARFLCELINEIGLLSKGNEEMVPFIWYQYIHYRNNPDDKARADKMNQMRITFCRPKDEQKPLVYWLGLWDCVASVAQFRGPGSKHAPTVNKADPNIAYHVRHAVSCHERRVEFKPTLFLEEPNRSGTLKETWFAGNHGDVGGGWDPLDGVLLSDIPMVWMVEELREVEKDQQSPYPYLPLSWRGDSDSQGAVAQPDPGSLLYTTYQARKQRLDANMDRIRQGLLKNAVMLWHDMLDRKRGPSMIMLPVWWLMEYMPLKHAVLVIKRAADWIRVPTQVNGRDEMRMQKPTQYDWRETRKPNKGSYRNIPLDAHFHPSVQILHDKGIIKSMAKWQFGPEGYKQLVKSETMHNGTAAPSQGHDHYMFIC